MAAHRKPNPGSLRSLAEAVPGEHLVVVHVLFESLRQKYGELGVGREIRCRARTADAVLVELPDGSLVAVDGVHAPFVEVRPTAARVAMESDEREKGGDPAVAPESDRLAPFPDRTPREEPGPQPRTA